MSTKNWNTQIDDKLELHMLLHIYITLNTLKIQVQEDVLVIVYIVCTYLHA